MASSSVVSKCCSQFHVQDSQPFDCQSMQVKLLDEVDARLAKVAGSDGTDKVQTLRDLKKIQRVFDRMKEAQKEAVAMRKALHQPMADPNVSEAPAGSGSESVKEPTEPAGHAAESAEHVGRSAEQGGEGEEGTSPTVPPVVSIVPTALRPENFPKVGRHQ